MKLSLVWLFEHIDADWKKIDVASMVALFNQKVAEIDRWYKVAIDLEQFTLAKITHIAEHEVSLESSEWGKTFTLAKRDDCHTGYYYLVKKDTKKSYSWASLADIGSSKPGLVSALSSHQEKKAGAWKRQVPSYDYILELDNKSVNHRPDLWGHRGVAREIAALLNLPLKPLDDCITHHSIKEFKKSSSATKNHPYQISIETDDCTRFSGLYFSSLHEVPSPIGLAFSLAKVDTRPISAVVDTTNYVMLDLAQPLHAFDAHAFPEQSVIIRKAKNKESLSLLDGQALDLTKEDIVIANTKKPVSLAGIMGGKSSGVTYTTQEVFLEAAHFNAATIRRSAQHHKIRTESSTRFEKGLDPDKTSIGILRFLHLLTRYEIPYKACPEIVQLGNGLKTREIKVSSESIIKKLGLELSDNQIKSILKKLEFGVDVKKGICVVTVPSFRAKDITIPEDIIEEVGRYYGFGSIEPVFIERKMKPFNLSAPMRMRKIKNHLAYALSMKELATYNFYDALWLKKIEFQPEHALQVKNPVSDHLQQLVTSLVPNILEVASKNRDYNQELRFFEWARTWSQIKNTIHERQSLAGVFLDQKKDLDFYHIKSELESLFDSVGIQVQWRQVKKTDVPWYMPYQTADIIHDDKVIARAGKVNPILLETLDFHDGFIFEIDASYILHYAPKIKKYTSPSKFPRVERDLSMLVPVSTTVDEIKTLLYGVDDRIVSVTLKDFFENPAWEDQRSITMSLVISDHEKTLESDEVDVVIKHAIKQLSKVPVVIR